MSQNLLANETSPYLLQHKDNPVHWRPWGPDALAEAEREGKPILLSIGYAACHWCHVMAHESFEDEAIARLMNKHFVNIKVDREERPDLDTIYMTALALMGEHGGWPLTMFLTPSGEPFWGGTYFPPTARYGRPGFPQILEGIAQTFQARPDDVRQNAAALVQGLARASSPEPGGGFAGDALDKAAREAVKIVDMGEGGVQSAPKFPQPSFFAFLWRAYRRTGDTGYRDAVALTLDKICQGGIYDHVGGGIARYSTDPVWLAPHFEKMLYDNAQLIELMSQVWLETKSPLLEVRIRETVAWLNREMRVADPGGADGVFAFASAYDADSDGEEGKFYVWTEAGIDSLLGADAEVFKAAYGVTPLGNWEGVNILNRSHAPALGDSGAEALLARCREKLLAERNQRLWPLWDDKVLADWNGLAIQGLARAGMALGEPAWIDAAAAAYRFVVAHMADGARLLHSWRAGRAQHGAMIDDYANMCRGALFLLEATGERAYLDQARAWVGIADRHYWDETGAGYFLSADDAEALITRSKTVGDNAAPAGNAVMAEVLARLYHITGNGEYRDRAERLINFFSTDDPNRYAGLTTLLGALELLGGAVQVVVVGAPGDAAAQGLADAALAAGGPNLVLSRVCAGDTLPQGHPAHGKGLVNGAAAAYVCRNFTCGLPATRPGDLRGQLAAR